MSTEATKVVHYKRDLYDIYIGRGSIFGNHWSHKNNTKADFVVKDREEAVFNYTLWLLGLGFKDYKQDVRQEVLLKLKDLKGKRLACWCSPQACHGDVLAAMADLL